MFDGTLQDIRHATRLLLKTPVFSVIAVATLAMGIGANTAIFTIVHSLLLRPLPYADADRLVTVWQDWRARGGPADEWVTPGNYADWRGERALFEELAVITGWRPTLNTQTEPEPIEGEQVSHEYFAVLGVSPFAGRFFAPEDDVPNAGRVVVVSHGLAERRFGGGAQALGQQVVLSGEPHEVVGIVPPGFRPIIVGNAEIWRPIRINTAAPARGAVTLRAIARLPAGLSLERAQTAADGVAVRLAQAHPQFNAQTGITLIPLHDRVVAGIRPGLLALTGAVAFVLLIACANITNLLLSRATVRRRELAVRAALGAGRLRIVRQLLTESLLLASIGGAAGVMVGVWALEALVAIAPVNTPRLEEIALDRTALAFSILVTLGTGLLFGVAPAFDASGSGAQHALRQGGRGAAGPGGRGLRQALIAAEVALALVLLVGGGLLFQTLLRLQQADLGFEPRNVLVADVFPPRTSYPTADHYRAYYDRLLEEAAALPGVRHAALSSVLPLGGDTDMSFTIEGRPPSGPSEEPATWYRLVSAGYFETMGIPLLRGRVFRPGEAEPVIVINRTFADRYFAGEDPIGRRLIFGDGPDAPRFTVIGIVPPLHARGARGDLLVEAFIPYWQITEGRMSILLKTGGEPERLAASLRQAAAGIDRTVPLSRMTTLEAIVQESLQQPRFLALLAVAFAGLAAGLAAIGIYGVMAYAVAQRTTEIGVRVALGATAGEIFRLILGDGLRVAGAGVAVGLALSLATARAIESLLFGVSAVDPATFAVMMGALLAVAGLACAVPAQRAARVDPMVALRAE